MSYFITASYVFMYVCDECVCVWQFAKLESHQKFDIVCIFNLNWLSEWGVKGHE